jgi:hypothetical protein
MFVVGRCLAGVTMVRGFRFATGLAWDFLDAVAQLRAGNTTWDQLISDFIGETS